MDADNESLREAPYMNTLHYSYINGRIQMIELKLFITFFFHTYDVPGQNK